MASGLLHCVRNDAEGADETASSVYPAVYIMASKRNGTVYTGVTSNLPQRVYQHKHAVTGGFTSKYECGMLVYYEAHGDMAAAITREKQIKAWRRDKKEDLIRSINPRLEDLSDEAFRVMQEL